MRAPLVLAVIGATIACRSGAPQLRPAGSKEDEGHGVLARASTRFMIGGNEEDLFATSSRSRASIDVDELGDGVGGSAYGGTSYATFAVPTWSTPSLERKPKYAQTEGLSGAIEGVVSWRGAPPPKLATACGAIEGLTLGANRALAGALVYIERVQVGRTLPYDNKPSSVGGVVVKRGCMLSPAVQIATPLPAALAIHGDRRAARLRVTLPVGGVRAYALQEAGRVTLQVPAGVSRVDAEDGSLGAAWVVALDTPYYAITDEQGRFRLDELGPGSYDVTIWQPPIPTVANGALSYGAPLVVRRTVAVISAKTARLDVALGR